MKRRSRIIATGLLVSLTVVLVLGIVSMHGWGGRMEIILMVFGDRVWVTLDAGNPRAWLLLIIPGVLLAGAFSLYRRRPGE